MLIIFTKQNGGDEFEKFLGMIKGNHEHRMPGPC